MPAEVGSIMSKSREIMVRVRDVVQDVSTVQCGVPVEIDPVFRSLASS